MRLAFADVVFGGCSDREVSVLTLLVCAVESLLTSRSNDLLMSSRVDRCRHGE